ncbi:MAG: DegT/DnrJ/EryC1/StrS family aminotransferase [Candidatus Aminicenantes bacterium]|nr:MAG: DegT/DnrJ/EryC1/StrS family aminotransferase [Candidatus Aminicenantes bacterium]
MKVEFFRHNIGQEEINKVAEVLSSIFLTTGDVVQEFEEKFSKYIKCKHSIGVTSCTAAMYLSLLAHNIGPGDEVITTPMSFIATANSILHTGAKPVFVDVESETGNINEELIEPAITDKTKAILPVHLYGQMCDIKKIKNIAAKYGLLVVEDAAHCIEGEREGIKPAQLSDTACFSFYATKNITSGEGGAISTNNEKIANKLRQLRLHGMTKGAAERYTKKYQHYDMELLGWKFNMDNIQAGLLLNQLYLIEKQLKRREQIWKMYEEAFSEVTGVDYPKILPNSRSARHLFTIWLDPKKRNEIIFKLQDQRIGVAVNFRPIHLMKYYRKNFGYKKGVFPLAEKIGASTITLPLYPKLTDEEVEYVIRVVKRAIS